MSYLSNQILYVGSHMGSSQIVKIHATAQLAAYGETLPIPAGIQTISSKQLAQEEEDVDMEDSDKRDGKGRIVRTRGNFVEILESFSNIAPIVDATLADIDGSGQVRFSLIVLELLTAHSPAASNRYLFRRIQYWFNKHSTNRSRFPGTIRIARHS